VITGINLNPVIVPVPLGVVTVTLPDAPPPTVASISVEDLIVKDFAAVPPNSTALVPEKLPPEMIILLPSPPLVADKEVI